MPIQCNYYLMGVVVFIYSGMNLALVYGMVYDIWCTRFETTDDFRMHVDMTFAVAIQRFSPTLNVIPTARLTVFCNILMWLL